MKEHEYNEAVTHLHEVLKTQLAETFPLSSDSGKQAAQFCAAFIEEFGAQMEKLQAA